MADDVDDAITLLESIEQFSVPQLSRLRDVARLRTAGRPSPLIEAFGRTQPLVAWAREYEISPVTIMRRLRAGWSDELAISLPSTTRRKAKQK